METQELLHSVRSHAWRASELAIARSTTHSSGYSSLDRELPDKGWPRSALIELLVEHNGIGEIQLLRPILSVLSSSQRVVFIQPPCLPHVMACRAWQINEKNIIWLRPKSSSDALWAAEQILKNGSCGAVILWQTHTRPEALRRLNLASQTTDTWFWLIRPLATASDPSPSPLRIGLRSAIGGISADIVKRRGPHCDDRIFIPLENMPTGRQLQEKDHETPVKRSPTISTTGSPAPALA